MLARAEWAQSLDAVLADAAEEILADGLNARNINSTART
jgi:hypothetical protein